MEDFLAATRTARWGGDVQAHTQYTKRQRIDTNDEAEANQNANEEADASESDSSVSAPTSKASDDEDDETDIHWILPAGTKTKLHVSSGLADERGQLIPRCQRAPFAWGYEEGFGLSSAHSTGRDWHARCFCPR